MSLHWFRASQTGTERRRRADRRARHVLFSDWRWAWSGRRCVSRRNGEAAEAGVDLYEPRLGILAITIFLLSCLDAAFTLTLVRAGIAAEANPIMRAILHWDAQVFVNLKIVLTGGGVIFLVSLADALLLRRVRVRRLMNALLATYVVIVAWEIVQLNLFRF
jgi:hypothetical protein